jgi:hypothetical protein
VQDLAGRGDERLARSGQLQPAAGPGEQLGAEVALERAQ